MAINRIRQWYDRNRAACAYDEGELLKKILGNVVGFDLNPLAVMAARTNYLVAIKDLVRHAGRVEIPVYLCDSIMTPSEYGDLFTGGDGKVAKVPCSAMRPPHLLVPKEIAQSAEEIGKYADILEQCVKSGYAASEFLSRCADEGLSITASDEHLDLYRELVKLDKANKNGVWARIIKNNFAPLFVGRVDYVAGNPPWVNYENLPADYRETAAKVWEAYNLFPKGGWRARFAKGNTELAMVFTYACADCYLLPAGRLGFVITQSVFQSKEAGRGFRAFTLGPRRKLRIARVDDFTAMRPFEGAVNRTATFSFDTSPQGTRFPVRYVRWSPRVGGFDSSEALPAVKRRSERAELSAWPVADELSPWMVLPKSISKATVEKVTSGRQVYRAWKGADTRGGNGVLWLKILSGKQGLVVARNTPEFSKKKPPEVTWSFEPGLIYPLLRGRETRRWQSDPEYALLYPHDGDRAIPEGDLKRKWPRTFAYLAHMEEHLRRRKMYDLSFRDLAFYSLFETGAFLLAPYKVVWKYVASDLMCAVLGPTKYDLLSNEIVLPDHKLVVVPCETEAEAHFVCAMLNSSAAEFVAHTYIVGTQISTHVLEYIKVPAFNPESKNHARLADLSKRCHAADGDAEIIGTLEAQIDKAAAKIWGITDDELASIQRAMADSRRARRATQEEDEDD
jgi:hypothetical protein